MKIAINFGHGVESDRGTVGFIAKETIITKGNCAKSIPIR